MKCEIDKLLVLVILLILAQTTSFGQTQIDSVMNLLRQSGDDVVLLNDIAELLSEEDPQISDSLALVALATAENENNLHEQARAAATISNLAYYNLNYLRVVEFGQKASELYLQLEDPLQAGYYANEAALAAYEIDLYDVSLRNYKKTIGLLIDSDATEFLPAILINMAQVYMRVAKYDSAIFYNEQAIALAQQAGMEAELSAGYGNLGFVYKSMGNYTKALEKYQQALEMSRLVGDDDMIGVDLNNIASIYLHWKNYEMALEYYQQALELHQTSGALEKAETTMNNIASVLQKLGDYTGAMNLYRESLAIAVDLGRTGSIAVKMGNIGGLHFDMGNYDSALYYQQEALRLSRELGRRFSECSSLQSLAATYVEINQPEQASYYLEQALGCATEIQANSILEKAYLTKSNFYEKAGDNAIALDAYRKHIAYRDSVFTRESKAKLDELEARYQNEKKQHEIEILLKDKALNESRINRSRIIHYWLGSGLAMFILASALVTWLLMQKSKANRLLVEKNLELMNNEECDEIVSTIKSSPGYSEAEKNRLINDLNHLIKHEKVFIQKQLTLNELAALLNTNTAYLSNVINQDIGRSFSEFINHFRVQEAQKMLIAGKQKSMTIEAIADAVGFKSRSTFHTAFRKFSGVTPTVFIKNVKKLHNPQKTNTNQTGL